MADGYSRPEYALHKILIDGWEFFSGAKSEPRRLDSLFRDLT